MYCMFAPSQGMSSPSIVRSGNILEEESGGCYKTPVEKNYKGHNV